MSANPAPFTHVAFEPAAIQRAVDYLVTRPWCEVQHILPDLTQKGIGITVTPPEAPSERGEVTS